MQTSVGGNWWDSEADFFGTGSKSGGSGPSYSNPSSGIIRGANSGNMNQYDYANNWTTAQDGYGNYAPNMGGTTSPYSLSSQLQYGGIGPSRFAIQGAADSYNTMANLGNTISSQFGAINASNQQAQQRNQVMGMLSEMLNGGWGGATSGRLQFQDSNSRQRAG